MTTHCSTDPGPHPTDEPSSAESGGVTRRGFVQILGAGLLISTGVDPAPGQPRRGGDRGGRGGGRISARLHVGADGIVTVLTGKVEIGQGSRAQLTQAAAEDLRLGVDRIRLIMADTSLVPDDGITAGSRTTPSTVPAVRAGAAAARGVLVGLACAQWKVKPDSVEAADGRIVHPPSKRSLTYADLARTPEGTEAMKGEIPAGVTLTPVKEWKVLGTSVPRPNRRDLVTGAHRYPSDITREGMLYGAVLRPPSYGATLASVDLSAAKAIPGAIVVREGEFVGCAAPTLGSARQAAAALAKSASWKQPPHPSSKELFAHLKRHARTGGGRGRGGGASGAVRDALAKAKKVLQANYEVAYVQHAPLEPRAAVAEWEGGKLTVWTGSQAPNRVHGELARTFGLGADRVRVVIPDTGGGFGGKHSGEAAVEAARLARGAKRPVCLRWSRREEFTWAYFRPAALIEARAGLDAKGALVAWDFTNINSGGSALDSPYAIPNAQTRYVGSDAPLRQGSYRCLAATANNFARESFMDELAAAAGADPLAFRLGAIKNDRLRAVLVEAARRFGWQGRKRQEGIGVGLACGTEKGSYVAACVEVALDRRRGEIKVNRVCEVFECGAVQNPANLRRQVEGCIIMGLGAALTEEIAFEKGRILNPSFGQYHVPHFRDVPALDIHLLDRPDLDSAGGGETPIIAVAPAIANAVCQATGVRIRSMPIRGAAIRKG